MMDQTPREAALENLSRGFLSIPLPFQSKNPARDGWQNERFDTAEKISSAFNCKPQNIGILTGAPSKGRVDVDLDFEEAAVVADYFLLPSDSIFGRPSKPRSHWGYIVDPVPETKKFVFNDEMVLEVRSTGCQTVVPPSVHPSGEIIAWQRNGPPANISSEELCRRAGIVAAGALLARVWPKTAGVRDGLAMALAGGLLRANWSVEHAEHFILAVCKAARDEEFADRSKKAEYTERKIQGGEAVTGWRTLSEKIGSKVIQKIREWLGIKSDSHDFETTFHLTDLGNSERFVAQHGDRIRFCHDWRKWLCWNGTCWEPDGTAMIFRLARQTMRSIYAEASQADDKEVRKAIVTHAQRCEAEGKVKAMVSLAESEAAIPILPRELDAHQMLLNCANVTIDLSTGMAREHRRSDFITRCLPFEYDSEALCPVFDRFLAEILANNAELIDFIQRAIGYSLTGATSEQVIFLLWGSGANGKSTLLEVLRFLLGDYSRQIQAESLMLRKFDNGQTNDIAALKGSRLVTSVETEDGHRLAEAKIKALSGGDAIVARHLYSEFFEFRPEFKLWLACNHKPVIRGIDLAIWRRIRLVPFTVTIPEERQDRGLLDKLRAELPGIMAWAVRGCLAWQKNGLGQPEEVARATCEYRDEMDILGRFLNDCCLIKKNLETKGKMLYAAYHRWANDSGERPITQTAFGRKLGEKGFDSYHSRNGVIWIGLGLIDEDEYGGGKQDLRDECDGFDPI
jgi:P4 family phage/plasmid primase-like protien